MYGRRLFPLLIAAFALLAVDTIAASAQSQPSASLARKESGARLGRKTLKPSQSQAARLVALYDTLAKAPNAEIAKLIENKIEATRLQSGSATADLLMARARLSAGEKNKKLALELLDAVVSVAPNFIEARAQRATLYYESKDIVRSLADLRVIVAKDPRHYNALTGLGVIFQELGEDRIALDAFRRALAVNPYIEGVPEFVKKLSLKVEGREI